MTRTLRNLPRLARTVRHLRASQLYWRVRYAIERRRAARAPAGDPGRAGFRTAPEIAWVHRPSPSPADALAQIERGRLTLAGTDVALGRPIDWRLGSQGHHRLWAINLHYHGWAHSLACSSDPRAPAVLGAMLGDWLERCDLDRPGARDLAWNSFAIATRLSWWCRMVGVLDALDPPGWPGLRTRLARSAARQAAWLRTHIEWDLRANHVLRDIAGLAWAGRCVEGASACLDEATALTPGQLDEQILADGAHYERSALYHLHAMEDVHALSGLLTDLTAADAARLAWRSMAECLRWLRFPGGELLLFNDGARAAGGSVEAMLRLAACHGATLGDPPDGAKHFAEAGIVAWHGRPWTLFFDVGPIGPDDQPGHGHADTLTIESAWKGRLLFVDPGTFAYDDDPRRRYDRSTAAHNTVSVDGEDSSEVWQIFRCGRRAKPVGVDVRCVSAGLEAVAGHDGFRHLEGSPLHRRCVRVGDDGSMSIVDRIEGRGRHRCSAGLLVEPSWSVERAGRGWVLGAGGERLRVALDGPEDLTVDVREAAYHPEYGVEQIARRLTWTREGTLPLEVRCSVEAV